MTVSFAVTWDYRCPFARNVHEYLITALEAEPDSTQWAIEFRAFSLDQTHVEEGAAPVWDEPERWPGLVANEVGIVVRDMFPDHFLALHRAMFAARHDQALDTRRREIIAAVLSGVGLEPDAVWAELEAGWPLETFRSEHDASAKLEAFGVPTFVFGERATFVRLLDRPAGDQTRATATVTRLVDLLTGWPELNEFKYTQLPN